jgi:hypothetical protein
LICYDVCEVVSQRALHDALNNKRGVSDSALRSLDKLLQRLAAQLSIHEAENKSMEFMQDELSQYGLASGLVAVCEEDRQSVKFIDKIVQDY